MKKILTITIISLLFALTATTSYAYWNGGKLSLPPLLSVHKTIRIGEWNHVESNGHPIVTIVDPDFTKLSNGTIFYKDGKYHLVTSVGGTWNFNSPWNNFSKPFGLDYGDNYYYEKGSFVFYGNKLYRSKNQGAIGHRPDMSTEWEMLGNSNSLRWKAKHAYRNNDVVFFNGKLYIRNKLNPNSNPQPSTGMGWNLYNDSFFDQYTVYEKYTWKTKRISPVVAAPDENGDLRWFKLITETNYINGRLVQPTEDNNVWSPYPYEKN